MELALLTVPARSRGHTPAVLLTGWAPAGAARTRRSCAVSPVLRPSSTPPRAGADWARWD